MPFSQTHYDAIDCTVMVGGVYVTGLAEDMVTGAKDEDYFSTQVGAQGDVVENEINNPLGTVTVKVQATSPQRSYLTNLAQSGEHLPVWVVNKTLGERFGGTNARVKTAPEAAQGNEAGDREFAFQVFDYTLEGI